MSNTVAPVKERLANYRFTTKSGRVIPMGVGCAYLGHKDKDETLSQEGVFDRDTHLLEDCYQAGFRMYDTSADYGNSELVVGRFLKQIPRKSVFLATKAPFDFHDRENGFENFKRTFYASFERLGVDHIDLYQIHDTNDYTVCLREVVPFLQDRKAEGMIDHIGMGTRSLHALELGIRDGVLESVLSYLEYSLLKTSALPLMAVAKQYGAAFLNGSCLHFGVVKAADPMNFALNYERLPLMRPQIRIREASAQMQALLRELGVPVIAAALQITLLNPDMDMLLNGIRRASNLASTLEALDREIYPEQWAAIIKKRDELPFASVQDSQ